MAQDSRNSLFMGALIGSAAGALLLLATDFGGWYNYYYYGGYAEWNYIGVSSPISLLGVILVCLPFFYSAFISLRGVQNPDSLTKKQVSLAFIISIIGLALIIVLAIIFVILVSGSDDWWFGAGFYGSIIGGALTVLFLMMVKKQYSAVPIFPGQPYQYGYPGNPQMQTQPYQSQNYPPPSGYPMQAQSEVKSAPTPPYQSSQVTPQMAPADQATAFCPYCGNKIPSGSAFCPHCGRPPR